MTDANYSTLAYSKSPKVSRRTTFQDELQAAVSARANKTKSDKYSYSDEFDDDDDDDDDDFLKELLNSRKKKMDAFKSGKTKATINDFNLSDDEGETHRPKRVSFLKSHRKSSILHDTVTTDSHEKERSNSSVSETEHSVHSSGRRGDQNGSFSQPDSKSPGEERPESAVSDRSGLDSPRPQSSRQTLTGSLSLQTSGASLLDTPLPLPSDSGDWGTPGPMAESSEDNAEATDQREGRKAPTPQPSGTDLMEASSTDSVLERGPPRPKPRQRTFGSSFHTVEERAADADSPLSRPTTSSVSIPLSTDTASSTTTTNTSSGIATDRNQSTSDPDGNRVESSILNQSTSTAPSVQSHSLSKSTTDSGGRGEPNSVDSKEHDGKYSTSFEELHEDSEDHGDHSVSKASDTHEKSSDSRPTSSATKGSSQRPRSACSAKVQSKYMGTLKVLDRKVPLQEAQPEAADTLRAAVYQEWLQKKKQTFQETMRLKKQEDNLKEEKRKQEEESKKEDAKASYQAWKEKKAQHLKAKLKEKEDNTRKEQRAIEEKEEKRQSAKKVFEKWKQEHDEQLKEKYRKQKESENKLKQKKQELEEERMKTSKSAFSNWDGKKKNALSEKATKELKEKQTKAEEERYMKEERDKTALEMYEKWLIKKERQQRRQREERKIQAILQDEPPPPWSPPNKTIPFGK